MNKQKIKDMIRSKGDRECDLAKKMGLSNASLSYKINNKTDFTRKDILKIKEIYNLNEAEIDDIFFNLNVSYKDTNA